MPLSASLGGSVSILTQNTTEVLLLVLSFSQLSLPVSGNTRCGESIWHVNIQVSRDHQSVRKPRQPKMITEMKDDQTIDFLDT